MRYTRTYDADGETFIVPFRRNRTWSRHVNKSSRLTERSNKLLRNIRYYTDWQ